MTAPAVDLASTPLALSVRDVGIAFPGVRALTGVHLDVAHGEVHALLGENGAGKSSLIKIVTGIQRPHTGSVTISGQQLRTFTPRAARKLGVRVVHQERQIAADLSVAHNVLIDDLPGGRLGVVTAGAIVRRAREELDRLGLDIDPRAMAGSLSAAQQQLVELARAVHRQAPLVIMDEPTASLRRDEVDALFEVIRRLRRSGTSLLYISHHLHEVFEIADTATVLRNGEVVAHTRVADTTSEALVSAMFDRDVVHTRLPRPARGTARTAVQARGVSRFPVLRPCDVELRTGEVLALCGGAGSGASELAEIMAGALPAGGGSVTVHGGSLRTRSIAAASGAGFVPADRKRDGLLLERPITENLVLSRRGWRNALFRPWEANRTARAAIARGRVRASDPGRAVSTLSGGNQQRTILARWLLIGCRVLILDQPTAGVDIASKFDIYQQLLDLTAQGMAVCIVSSDYEEISCLADRVIVMRNGDVVAELDAQDADAERLYQLEMGAPDSTGRPRPQKGSAR